MLDASPELEALIDACRARPADDLPRLVLADWLDESGESDRAELVRVQVELSHPTGDNRRMVALRASERELLARCPSTWMDEFALAIERALPDDPRQRYLAGGYGHPRPCQLRRGLGHVHVTPWLLGRETVRDWLARLPVWIESVHVRYERVDSFVKAEFPDALFGRLQLTLALHGEAARLADPEAELRQFALSSNFAALQGLELAGLDGGMAIPILAGVGVDHLTRLVVDCVGRSRYAASVLSSASTDRLSTLDLGLLDEAALKSLLRSTSLGQLAELRLHGSPIGDAGFIALCESPLAGRLRSVCLANTGIGDRGAAALAASPLIGAMHGPKLNLMMNHIGDAGLAALAACEHLLRFDELVLRENAVGDSGIISLAASEFAANLRYLDCWRNRIGDAGARALANSRHLNRLVDLSVKENSIADPRPLIDRYGEAAKC